MQTESITVYIGQWNDKEYTYALSFDIAKRLIEKSFAFGDPNIDTYAVGSRWASGGGNDGWHIVKRDVLVAVIPVEIKISEDGDYGHVLEMPLLQQALQRRLGIL